MNHHPHLVTRAFEANRNLAAAEERDAVVAFLRRQSNQLALEAPSTADLLRAAAMCIEAGDHRR